jgi:hypothetical protein
MKFRSALAVAAIFALSAAPAWSETAVRQSGHDVAQAGRATGHFFRDSTRGIGHAFRDAGRGVKRAVHHDRHHK